MNVKKILENRIRGWFPQEPKLSKRLATTNNKSDQPQKPMATTKFVLTGLIGVILLTIGYFSGTLPYIYRTAIGFFGILLTAISVFLAIKIQSNKPYPVSQINLRIRYCVLLIIFGSFLGGAVAGIIAYDGSYWGINTTLYKLSSSFSINLPNNELVYMSILLVGVLIATFGCVALGRKYSPSTQR
jgi:hypothetical protein